MFFSKNMANKPKINKEVKEMHIIIIIMFLLTPTHVGAMKKEAIKTSTLIAIINRQRLYFIFIFFIISYKEKNTPTNGKNENIPAINRSSARLVFIAKGRKMNEKIIAQTIASPKIKILVLRFIKLSSKVLFFDK